MRNHTQSSVRSFLLSSVLGKGKHKTILRPSVSILISLVNLLECDYQKSSKFVDVLLSKVATCFSIHQKNDFFCTSRFALALRFCKVGKTFSDIYKDTTVLEESLYLLISLLPIQVLQYYMGLAATIGSQQNIDG